jgi:CheY-like chemotaxis protein
VNDLLESRWHRRCESAGAARSPMPVNVLLFDQDPILSRVGALMLRARGADVTVAATVDELVVFAGARIYDVAVIDVGHSPADAAAVVARLRAALVPRRIVLCSPVPIARHESEAFTEVLLKPYPFQRLIAAVFGPADRRRRVRSGVFLRGRRPVFEIERDRPRPSLRVVAPLAEGRSNVRSIAAEARTPGVTRSPKRAVRVRRGRG